MLLHLISKIFIRYLVVIQETKRIEENAIKYVKKTKLSKYLNRIRLKIRFIVLFYLLLYCVLLDNVIIEILQRIFNLLWSGH